METVNDKVHRWSNRDAKAKEVLKEILQEQTMAEYQFQPKINEKSRKMVEGRSIHDLTQDQSEKLTLQSKVHQEL